MEWEKEMVLEMGNSEEKEANGNEGMEWDRVGEEKRGKREREKREQRGREMGKGKEKEKEKGKGKEEGKREK